MTEKEAWEDILDAIQNSYWMPWLCHRIDWLHTNGNISTTIKERMLAAIEAARKAKHLTKDRMVRFGLWPYKSTHRIAWVKKQIKRLEKNENVPL